MVDNALSDVYNHIGKKSKGKFYTYPRHIIPNHSFFSLKQKKDKYNITVRQNGNQKRMERTRIYL